MICLDCETTTLNADLGILVAIGFILPNNGIRMFFVETPEKEKDVLIQSIEFVSQYKQEPIIIWYAGFDIPFLVTRAAKHEIDISEIYQFKIIDLCKLIQNNLKLENYSLNSVAKFFGIEIDSNVSGKNVQTLYLNWLNGDIESKNQIIQHCEQDLIVLKKIFEKVEPYFEKWIKINKSFK